MLCFGAVVGCVPQAEPEDEAPVAEENAPAEEAPATAEEPVEEKVYRVGMILSGPITDASWNGPQYNGLLEIEKLGAEIAYQENIAVSDVAEALYSFAEEDYDCIFFGTNYYQETILPICAEFPEITFFITNGTVSEGNVHSFQVADEQQGFMMGVVAALASKTGQVGFVGGRESTPIYNGQSGFQQGVAYVNSSVVANCTITGTVEDVMANKEVALNMAATGCDVIVPLCDNAALGVVETAQESGVLAVGSGKGQHETAPDAVLVEVCKDTSVAIKAAYESFLAGNVSTETYKVGAAEGVVHLSDWFAPADGMDDVKARAQEIYEELAAGKIKITLDE